MDKLRKLVRSQFEQDYGGVQRMIKAELHLALDETNGRAAARRSRMVGLFVGVCAVRMGINAEGLARAADIPIDSASALMKGELAHEALTDDMLARVAQAINYDLEFLKIMRGETHSDEATA